MSNFLPTIVNFVRKIVFDDGALMIRRRAGFDSYKDDPLVRFLQINFVPENKIFTSDLGLQKRYL